MTSPKAHFNSSLPAELKAEIFKEVCFADLSGPDSSNFTLYESFTGPWGLRLVCKLWHRFISNTPELWTTVILRADYGSEKPPAARKVLNRHLNHLRKLPFRILLFIPKDYSGQGKQARTQKQKSMDGRIPITISSVLDVLTKESKRITYLGIEGGAIPPPKVVHKFRKFFLSEFPVLEAIKLRDFGRSFPKVDKDFKPFQNKTPHLRMLALTQMVYWGPGALSFDLFTPITDLRLTNISVGCCIEAISHFPQLKYLSLASITEHCASSSRMARSTFSLLQIRATNDSLTSLTITGSFEGDVIILLTQITLPELRHMDLRGIYKYSKMSWRQAGEHEFKETLVRFLKRSGCSLLTLRMSVGDVLWQVLDWVHTTLEELHLDKGHSGEELVLPAVLFQRLCSATNLPQLQLIHFHNVSSEYCDYSLILDALSSSHKNGSKLTVFKLEIDDVSSRDSIPDTGIVKGFNQLIREGMHISFKLLDCYSDANKKNLKAAFLDKLLLN